MNAKLQALAPAGTRRASSIADYVALTKPRITFMVLVTVLVGFVAASRESLDPMALAAALVGTALAASGAAALNMVLEREADGRMQRTADRPIPAGRLEAGEAAIFGTAAAVAGVVWLATINLPTGALGALTVVLYLFAYTPLKARTSLSTVVGAVPGALPAGLGWTAASGRIDAGAVALFLILFFWQLPHFLAIAWIHREDYARAGFPLLPVAEPDGSSTGRQTVVQSVALLAVSLLPFGLGMAGAAYLAGALALGLAFLASGAAFAWRRSNARARRLFLASVVYLPVLLALLALDRPGF